jgi:hypothetical protein
MLQATSAIFLSTVLCVSQEFFTYMETSLYHWRAAKFKPMLGAQGLWAGRDLYRATPAVTQGLGFSGLIWTVTSYVWLARGWGGPVLTQILTYSNLGPWSLNVICVVNNHFRLSQTLGPPTFKNLKLGLKLTFFISAETFLINQKHCWVWK